MPNNNRIVPSDVSPRFSTFTRTERNPDGFVGPPCPPNRRPFGYGTVLLDPAIRYRFGTDSDPFRLDIVRDLCRARITSQASKGDVRGKGWTKKTQPLGQSKGTALHLTKTGRVVDRRSMEGIDDAVQMAYIQAVKWSDKHNEKNPNRTLKDLVCTAAVWAWAGFKSREATQTGKRVKNVRFMFYDHDDQTKPKQEPVAPQGFTFGLRSVSPEVLDRLIDADTKRNPTEQFLKDAWRSACVRGWSRKDFVRACRSAGFIV